MSRNRARLYPPMEQLIKALKEAVTGQVHGEPKYIIIRLLRALYQERYFDFNRIMGVLESVKQEYYRLDGPVRRQETRRRGDIS